jgi:predicted component of type VI protein secretion system
MDIVLADDRAVSALHAELACLGGTWILSDDGLSKNGTFVNGRRLTGRRRLRGGDELSIGRTRLVFHEAASREQCTESGPGPTAGERALLDALAADDRVPATDTAIAAALERPLAHVREELAGLCAHFEITSDDPVVARAELARRWREGAGS